MTRRDFFPRSHPVDSFYLTDMSRHGTNVQKCHLEQRSFNNLPSRAPPREHVREENVSEWHLTGRFSKFLFEIQVKIFLFVLSPLLICSASSKVSGSGSFSVDGNNLKVFDQLANQGVRTVPDRRRIVEPSYHISCTIDMQATARTKIPYFVATTNAAKHPPRLPIESNIPIALFIEYQGYIQSVG